MTREELDELERDIDLDVGAWDLPGVRSKVLAQARRSLDLEEDLRGRVEGILAQARSAHTRRTGE